MASLCQPLTFIWHRKASWDQPPKFFTFEIFWFYSICGVDVCDFRVNLDLLQNPDEAVRIVRETRSVDGAKMVAK